MKNLILAFNIVCVLVLAACGQQEYSTGSISNLANASLVSATDQNKIPTAADANNTEASKEGCKEPANPESKSSGETNSTSCEKSGESDHDDDHESDHHADAQESESSDEDCSD